MASSWRTRLAIVAGVLLTMFVSLLLAQVDTLQRRSAMPARSLPVVDVQATLAAAEWTIVQLLEPSATATAVPTDPPSDSTAALATATLPCASVPTDWIPYAVQPGETISVLAARSNTTVQLLVLVNCLPAEDVEPGAIIYLPPQAPLTSIDLTDCRPPLSWRQVPIAAGTNLSVLALQYRTTVYEIMRANCLETDVIYAGRLLYLPAVLFPTAIPPTAVASFTPTLIPSATPTTAIPTPTATISETVVPVTVTPTTAVPTTVTPTATTGTPTTVTPSPTPQATTSATVTPTPPAGSPSPTVTAVITPTATPESPTATPTLPAETATSPPPSPTAMPPTATATIAQPSATPIPPPPTSEPTAVPTEAPTASP